MVLDEPERAARNAANLRRGFFRLGLGLAALWLVFWTFAYVISPHKYENEPITGPAYSWTMGIALLATAIVAAPWIVSGLRPD